MAQYNPTESSSAGSSVHTSGEAGSRATGRGAEEAYRTGQDPDAAASLRQVTHNFFRALDRSLDEQPMTTLGLAAVIGFVLGAVWKA